MLLQGSYECFCLKGYEKVAGECVDVNEVCEHESNMEFQNLSSKGSVKQYPSNCCVAFYDVFKLDWIPSLINKLN